MSSLPSMENLGVEIVKKLFENGFVAYFAGGWVRDRLLGIASEEIDIATSAPPEKVMALFSRTIAVGVRFGVVVVVLEGKNFEVTTFRKDHPYLDGRHPAGVDFSNAEHDAQRRDFTINGMFYDPLSATYYDYVEGKKDLEGKIIRAIGDPHKRFEEDKLRMLRAVRFAIRLGFTLEQKTAAAITVLAPTLLPAVSMERVNQELTKMSQYPHFDQALLYLHQLGLLPVLFPALQNLSHETLAARCAPFPYFPLHTPLMLYLKELFPNYTLKEFLSLASYLKISTKETAQLTFFIETQKLFQNPSTPYAWAHFYAHKESPLFLDIAAAKLLPPERAPFIAHHATQRKSLYFHIEKLIAKTPLLTAERLQKEGIPPGVTLGQLLKEGEKLSINLDLRDPSLILDHLKKTPLWPK